MRTPLATIVAVALAVATLAAPCTSMAQSSLGASTWSLEIGTSLGDDGNDVAFAVRRHANEHSAFRFGIELGVSDSDGDGTRFTTGLPDRELNQFSNENFHTLSVQWMRFATLRNDVTGTFATGPFVSRSGFAFRSGQDAGTATFSETEFSNESTTFGWDLMLGAEWFFNRRLSLGGETGFRAELGTSENVTIVRTGTGATYEIDERRIEADVKELRTRGGRIHLTAYF